MNDINLNPDQKAAEPVKPIENPGNSEVLLSDFKKLDIRVAKILEAIPHPQADKLLLVKIDVGHKIKQVVAGIREFYKCEDLIGRSVIVIDNLKPVTLRGQVSEGMILAAKDVQGLKLLVPDGSVEIGSKVS